MHTTRNQPSQGLSACVYVACGVCEFCESACSMSECLMLQLVFCRIPDPAIQELVRHMVQPQAKNRYPAERYLSQWCDLLCVCVCVSHGWKFTLTVHDVFSFCAYVFFVC